MTPSSGVSQYAHSPPQSLIDICQQAPCTNHQEFEIFDQNGAQIFSVGEYGGASIFGDDFRVWAPGTNLLAGTAAVTLSWESPGEYDRQFKLAEGCMPPAIWESPQGIWACTPSREWKIALRILDVPTQLATATRGRLASPGGASRKRAMTGRRSARQRRRGAWSVMDRGISDLACHPPATKAP